MAKILATLTLVVLPTAGVILSAADSFEKIKASMAEAACNRFEFLSIIESDVFDSVDTTAGNAYIARDGRYSIEIGTDRYLYDLEFLYSYSQTHAQATIEKADPHVALSEEVSYITRLDEFYRTFVVRRNSEYRLVKIDSTIRTMPDSMQLVLNRDGTGLTRIEYFDSNEDLNRIVFLSHEVLRECDEAVFEAVFPDSVETIKLY
jgi:hypothetical protein